VGLRRVMMAGEAAKFCIAREAEGEAPTLERNAASEGNILQGPVDGGGERPSLWHNAVKDIGREGGREGEEKWSLGAAAGACK